MSWSFKQISVLRAKRIYQDECKKSAQQKIIGLETLDMIERKASIVETAEIPLLLSHEDTEIATHHPSMPKTPVSAKNFFRLGRKNNVITS